MRWNAQDELLNGSKMLMFLNKVQHKYLWTLFCHSTDSINTSTLYFLCVFPLVTSIVIWLLYVNIARLSNTCQSFNIVNLLYDFRTTYHGLCCEVCTAIVESEIELMKFVLMKATLTINKCCLWWSVHLCFLCWSTIAEWQTSKC